MQEVRPSSTHRRDSQASARLLLRSRRWTPEGPRMLSSRVVYRNTNNKVCCRPHSPQQSDTTLLQAANKTSSSSSSSSSYYLGNVAFTRESTCRSAMLLGAAAARAHSPAILPYSRTSLSTVVEVCAKPASAPCAGRGISPLTELCAHGTGHTDEHRWYLYATHSLYSRKPMGAKRLP